MKNICIWGDSITEGYFDTEGGWVDRFKRYSWQKYGEESDGIYNLGVSGDTSKDLLKRFKVESQTRQPDLAIIAIGINDSLYFNGQPELCQTSQKDFQRNLQELVNFFAIRSRIEIIFIGLTPVIDDQVQPIPWASNKYYANDVIVQYDQIIQKVAQENNCRYCYLYDLLKPTDLSDGLHPNNHGHQKIFEKVKEFLGF